MKGRKPLPTDNKRLTGNPGRRPLNNREPNPAQLSSLDIPEELGRDAIAIAEWQRLAPMLHTCKQVTEADKTSLICLCLEWSRYLKARRKSAGARAVRGDGTPNPWNLIARHAFQACVRLWPELGLTPSSRSRVYIP